MRELKKYKMMMTSVELKNNINKDPNIRVRD